MGGREPMAWACCLLTGLLCACGPSPVERLLRDERLYERAFTGFSLVDVQTGESLSARHADRLYTPASNAKVLTLATAFAWLPGDSTPALAYRVDGDTLRLWGLAYPRLGMAGDPTERSVRPALATWPGPVEVSLHGYATLPRFGEGWMWDDYNDAYMPERSGLPVYGNMVSTWVDGARPRSRPAFVQVRPSTTLPRGVLRRDEHANRFRTREGLRAADTLTAPLYAAAALVAQLLEDYAGRPIRYHAEPLPSDWGSRVWRGLPRDSLIRAMMLPSDNFVAEHLLLMAGLYGHDLTDPVAIRRAAARDVLHLPDSVLRWADGSGLSHYNLISPAAMTKVLVELARREGLAKVTRLFAAGGRDGTIAEWYADEDEAGGPYVFAKTGTLRHNSALSGFLRARSGRWLAFSFLHNHYPGGSASYKQAMQRTLNGIRDAY